MHEGANAGRVTPIEILKTDRYRLDTFTREFSISLPKAMNRNYARSSTVSRRFARQRVRERTPRRNLGSAAAVSPQGVGALATKPAQQVPCRPRVFHRGSRRVRSRECRLSNRGRGTTRRARCNLACSCGSPPATAPNGAQAVPSSTPAFRNATRHVWGRRCRSDKTRSRILEEA